MIVYRIIEPVESPGGILALDEGKMSHLEGREAGKRMGDYR